ncbi:hypothetical protein ACLB2K_018429 [Fragaria x ananassa]
MVELLLLGVYGDCGGTWVDEDYPPNPTREVGKLRLAAEKGWLQLGQSLGLSTKAFRLGGIYGPGRREIYNIVDDDPAPREAVFEYARDLVDRKWPGWIKQSSEQRKSTDTDKQDSLLGEKSLQCSYEEGARSQASSS